MDNATLVVTNTNDSGVGSLRQAIIDANAKAGVDTINFDARLEGQTIVLSSGELVISDGLIIDGDFDNDGTSDITVDANSTSGVFSIDDENPDNLETVVLEGVTVTGGTVSGIRSSENLILNSSIVTDNVSAGGGGGILSAGRLVLRKSAVTNNASVGSGGGVLDTGRGSSLVGSTNPRLIVVDSTIADNETTGGEAPGGGFSSGLSTVTNSVISGNSTAGYNSKGGGIAVGFGTLSVRNSTISGNSTSGSSSDGGGIYGEAFIIDSTISDNFTTGFSSSGGGVAANNFLQTFPEIIPPFIFGGSVTYGTGATIINTTISGNRVTGSYSSGGGIVSGTYLDIGTILENVTITNNAATVGGGGLSSFGLVTIDNSTISNNTADVGSGVEAHSPIEVRSSIVSGNANNDDVVALRGDSSKIISKGNNLVGGGNVVAAFNQPTDIINTNPRLGPLQDNGGPTKTLALLPDSPAINSGSNEANLTTDQRGSGFLRSFGQTDIGAFELQSQPNFAVPFVSINALDDTVIEGNIEDIGLYAISRRAGSMDKALTVQLQLPVGEGLGIDEFNLSGGDAVVEGSVATVTIPAGQTEVLLTLTANDNTLTEVVDVVKITFIPSASYAIDDGADIATVSIIDDDTLVTNTNDAGDGSLRQAIINANDDRSNDSNRVDFSSSLGGATIAISSGELSVTDTLVVDGDLDNDGAADITIDANQISRVFVIDRANVTLEGLIVTGGKTTGEGEGGGGILNAGRLTVSNSTVHDNVTTGNSSGGGGIDNRRSSNLVVSNSTISNNMTTGDRSDGGGITTADQSSRVTINNSIVDSNATTGDSSGGGIFNADSLTIDGSTLRNNRTVGNGGAIDNNGRLEISNSTVSDNAATGAVSDGGGIRTNYRTIRTGYRTEILNVTVSGNTATNRGGGLLNFDGTTVVTNSTFSNNTAEIGSGITSFGDSVTFTEVRSSIISGNSGDRDVDLTNGYINSFTSNGNNLVGSGSAIAAFNSSTDIITTSPQLGPLQNNGGTTETQALQSDSLALNAGANPETLATDQRGAGFSRTIGQTDIGAFELQQAGPTAVDDSFTTDEDTALNGSLLVDNGSGADSSPNDASLAIARINNRIDDVGSAIALGNGTLTVNSDGTFVFDPAGGYEALATGASITESFTYSLRGGSPSEAATVTLTIEGIDDIIPFVKDQAATIFVDATNTVVGNTFQAGQTYGGILASNTDSSDNPDDVIAGTTASDNIWGGLSGNDTIAGFGGNDIIGFGAGDACVDAGRGDDFVYAVTNLSGNSQVDLGSGTDNFYAIAGNNSITGRGNNTIGIGKDNDSVTTFEGNDVVYTVGGGGGNNALNLGNGQNIVWAERGNYTITTGIGRDILGLGDGTDTVNAGDGDNLVYSVSNASGDGNKDVITGAGNDYIQTSFGDDLIDGGVGFNSLFGGEGADVFAVRSGAYNFIGDFEVGTDKIDLKDVNTGELTFYQGTGETIADAFVFLGLEAIAQVANTQITALSSDSFV